MKYRRCGSRGPYYAPSPLRGGATKGWKLDVFGVGVVFDRVAGILAFMIHFVLFDVAIVNILRGHAHGLGHGNEEVKEVDDLDAGVLLVDLLVFGPPLPRETIDQLGQLLAHGARVVERPLGFFVGGKVGQIDPDLFVEEVLHAEDFV